LVNGWLVKVVMVVSMQSIVYRSIFSFVAYQYVPGTVLVS